MSKKLRARRRQNSTNPSKRRPLPLWIWVAGGGTLALVVVVGLLYLGFNGNATVRNDIDGLVILSDPGRGHQDGDISYAQDVPVGGVHNPTWLNCGIYDEPVRPENAVHSMEHGAVWLAYQPDLPTDQVNTLRELVRAEQSRLRERMIILAPKPDLEVPIVATAWRVQLRLEEAEDERLAEFVKRYQRGPFTPEPGADCTFSGTGEPMS